MSVQRHRVAWPYVTLKVLDEATGSTTIRGLSEGGLVPLTADAADVRRLVGKGALVADPDTAAPPVVLPEPELPADPPAAEGRPKDYASKGEWVDYAVSRRSEDVSEEDARAVAELSSKADLIAEFG